MSANIRATPPPSSSGRHGSSRNVLGSGSAIMSDSSIALKPVIDEPSKPMPASKAPSRSWELIEKDFSWPRMSVNQSRMNRTPVSRTWARTSSAVVGCSSVSAIEARTLQPAQRPRAQLAQGGGQLAAHVRQPVLDTGGRPVADVALDDPARPALADQLDGLVQIRAARARALQRGDRDLPAGGALPHGC